MAVIYSVHVLIVYVHACVEVTVDDVVTPCHVSPVMDTFKHPSRNNTFVMIKNLVWRCVS